MPKARQVFTVDAIAAVLGSSNRRELLSARDAVRKVRALVPGCELTDRELADVIVLHAMRREVSAISFDLNAKRAPFELVDRQARSARSARIDHFKRS